MRTRLQQLVPVLLVGTAIAGPTGMLRAASTDGVGVSASASKGQELTIPTSRGAELLTVGAPDAFESAAQSADPGAVPLRVRARIIVRAADRAAMDGALARAKSVLVAAPAGAPQEPLAGFWLVDAPTIRQATTLAVALRADVAVTEAYLDTHRFHARGLPTDPGFPSQWYLNNTITPAASINVSTAWMWGFTGAGVTVGVIDEGFNTQHPDLAANFVSTPSQPDQGYSDHGTSSAGLVAMVANNGKGGAGTAYNAKIARLYYGFESDNAAAFGLRNDLTSIKTNSWGPSDNGNIYPMSSIELAALSAAVTTGRGGKGEVVVWACGNGRANNSDRVDYDGYGSNRYSIAIGAIDNTDRSALYSEPGSALMLVTTSSYDFAGSGGSGIYSTVGVDSSGPGSYTSVFGGTSAAAPIAAGAIALILQANPNLGWRDVQHVLIRTARRVNPAEAGWVQNGAGRFVNEQYGFGAIDASAAVSLAQTFTPRPAEVAFSSNMMGVAQSIPDNTPAGLTSAIVVPMNLAVERVQVVLNAPHANIGDLRVVLTSPSGSTSVLADTRFDFSTGYNNQVFTSVRHWDERAHGVWTLRVSDTRAGTVGTFNSWQLKVYGAAPQCPCDWSGHGLNVQTIFDFLSDWFAGRGDFNNDGNSSVQDIFDFLNCWFGHPDGCG